MALGIHNGRGMVATIGWRVEVCLLAHLVLLLACFQPAHARGQIEPAKEQSPSTHLQGLATADPAVQEEALTAIVEMNDPALLPALTALYEGTLRVWKQVEGAPRLVILQKKVEPDGRGKTSLVDPLTGRILAERDENATEPEPELTMVSLTSTTGRRLLKAGLDRLKLFDPSADTRRAAAIKLGNAGDVSVLPLLDRALARENVKWARHAMEEAINQLRLEDPDPRARRDAATRLGEIKGLRALPRLKSLLAEEPVEPDEAVRKAIQGAIERIETYQDLQGFVGVAFYGLSLGSILFLMGLGLAITYGLMGVINMAHGEMMMIGAYTAFVFQELFLAYLPSSLHDFYFLVALPASFLVTGGVGFLLEQTVIRFLYGRPLETLLATWGVSMVLQQAARWYFGDLTSVNAPSWMRGGVEPMVGLVLPYNRIFVIVLGGVALLGVHWLLSRTRWGLLIRAVTQNRGMSACLGISTRRVDAWTFAFGAGLAGVAGCAISLIGNVDPEMGKTYIVESFMVVVVGGVGKLAGTVVSAMGIGMLNKVLEPLIGGTGGAIYAKLFILAAIILFLQGRPTGLFPAKGRVAEAGS